MNLEIQRKAAEESLPEIPLRDQSLQTSELRRFEVVLAYNLEPPYRYRQDYWWLEVLAENPRGAHTTAALWILEQEEPRFEATGWVRSASPHINFIRLLGDPEPLRVRWDLPVDKDWVAGREIRNPATGAREGYLEDPLREQEILKNLAPKPQGDYRVLKHRPVESTVLCLLPGAKSVFTGADDAA